jgi:hypothetical protein
MLKHRHYPDHPQTGAPALYLSRYSRRNDTEGVFNMVTRIWHGATPLSKSDDYLTLMRTVAIPDYRSTPGNKGAYALRRIEGGTAHFLMVTFWESEVAVRAFAGDDINVAKYYDFDKDFLLELEPCSSHYETYEG